MGSSTTDGNRDASASDLSSTDAETEGDAPPVVRSRFLRAMNYFPEEKTIAEILPNPPQGPSPVVVIRDDDNEAVEETAGPDAEISDQGIVWRQGLMAMDGIELPEFEDLDSLPASDWQDDESGVILSPLDASWDADESTELVNAKLSWNDPRQLWLNTEESAAEEVDRQRSGAGKIEFQAESESDVASEAASEAETNNDHFALSERQKIMSNEGMKPYSETAAIPPVQKTRLWTGLGKPAKKPSTASDAESLVVAADKEWSDQSADVAFVAAILEDVPAPDVDPAATLDDSELETSTASSRGAGVSLVPGWKPVRDGLDGKVGTGGGDEDHDESGDDEVVSRGASIEKVDTESADRSEGDSDESSEAARHAVVRAPRHDSIVEGFGNFLNDTVVLDAAYTEPDFKALNPGDDAAPEAEAEAKLPTDAVEEIELETETEAEVEQISESVALEADSESSTADADADAALSSPIEVVAPDELDPDDAVPAAIVAPALIDGEDDDAGENELSELGMAGLSVLTADDGEEEATPLLDKLTDEEADVPQRNDEQEIDRFGALSDDDETSWSGRASGFTSGNPALVRHGVRCPECDQALRIQNRYVGIEGRCPGCAEMIVAKRMVTGLVIADLAEVEAPKFFQQPDIEPGGIRGGTRLAAGGGAVADPDEEEYHKEEEAKDAEPERQVEAEKESVIVEEETAASEAPENSEGDIEVSDDSSPNDDSSAAPEAAADPFSNPSRLAVDQSNETDGVWGGGIGKSTL